jgi:hypothetical protein
VQRAVCGLSIPFTAWGRRWCHSQSAHPGVGSMHSLKHHVSRGWRQCCATSSLCKLCAAVCCVVRCGWPEGPEAVTVDGGGVGTSCGGCGAASYCRWLCGRSAWRWHQPANMPAGRLSRCGPACIGAGGGACSHGACPSCQLPSLLCDSSQRPADMADLVIAAGRILLLRSVCLLP